MVIGYRITIHDKDNDDKICYQKDFLKIKPETSKEEAEIDVEEFYNLQFKYPASRYKFDMATLIG